MADQTDGDFIIKIKAQTASTKINVIAKDAAGNVSAATAVTVTA